jgi:flagellar hook assembly protein FlgD
VATTSVAEEFEAREAQPENFVLQQNYPNPFNSSTVINYNLPEAANVRITVFDILGQNVATLMNGKQGAGSYKIDFNGLSDDGMRLSSGVYLCRLEARGVTKNIVEMIKMSYIQ